MSGYFSGGVPHLKKIIVSTISKLENSVKHVLLHFYCPFELIISILTTHILTVTITILFCEWDQRQRGTET